MQAVIFDMDGIIFDTERLGLVAIREAAAEQQLTLSQEMVYQQLGKTLAATNEALVAYAPGVDTQRLWQQYNRRMKELFVEEGKPFKPGFLELLKLLKELKVPVALCSGSPREMVDYYLQQTGLTDAFRALVTGSDGLASKPAPDMFLAAARAIGADPTRSLVLEDSINGIKAARAAGTVVGMVPDLVPYDDTLSEYVDHVFPSLLQVVAFVEEAFAP